MVVNAAVLNPGDVNKLGWAISCEGHLTSSYSGRSVQRFVNDSLFKKNKFE